MWEGYQGYLFVSSTAGVKRSVGFVASFTASNAPQPYC